MVQLVRKARLLFLLAAVATLPAAAVQIGDTLEQVLAEKGKPDNQLQAGATTLLTFSGETIKLKQGKVVAIKTAAQVADSGITVVSAPFPVTAPGKWTTDYAAALAQARNERKKVFLFFTGSDWCNFCIRLDDEILDTRFFRKYARENLILVKLDFPRRHPQSAELQEQNQRLAEKYRVNGYPCVIVLNSAAQQVGALGYTVLGPEAFVKQLASF